MRPLQKVTKRTARVSRTIATQTTARIARGEYPEVEPPWLCRRNPIASRAVNAGTRGSHMDSRRGPLSAITAAPHAKARAASPMKRQSLPCGWNATAHAVSVAKPSSGFSGVEPRRREKASPRTGTSASSAASRGRLSGECARARASRTAR